MCGIAGIFGFNWERAQLAAMIDSQHHRGPDADGLYIDPSGRAGLGHNRLSIIDLSEAGRQPMASHDGRLQLVFNGEIYNYLELRAELDDYPYHSRTDSEVILAAYERWGKACLDHFIGMFSFAIWDEREQRLFAARDRFGQKPLYYHHQPDGTLLIASEIAALHAAGVPACSDPVTWATYLTYGLKDHTERTFWRDITSVPGGHTLTWENGKSEVACWYDVAEHAGPGWDERPLEVVQEELLTMLTDSVRLRFRSDVPVGINLSGGLDSSLLLGLVHAVQGPESDVKAFTFITGDDRYDELPWVSQLLERTHHPSVICRLDAEDVPALAESVQAHQGEPFGGLPTLAYARLFNRARAEGVIVLLDGQALDEQWAGYDYYQNALDGTESGMVQGTKSSVVYPECLVPEFRALAEPFVAPRPFPDALRNVQYRDVRYTKMPRALRFNDRVSMQSSTELRSPFLDHRLFELAFQQPADRKIRDGTRKWLPRSIAGHLLPQGVVEAPKRPLQTPQREWLRGPLREWATACIDDGLAADSGAWLDADMVRAMWQSYCGGAGDNSFLIWQWITVGLLSRQHSSVAKSIELSKL